MNAVTKIPTQSVEARILIYNQLDQNDPKSRNQDSSKNS